MLSTKTNNQLTGRQILIDMVLIITAAALVYGQVAGFELLTNWDDPEYITQNNLIHSLSWSNIKASFTSTLMGNYAPIQNLSYMLDVLLGGGKIKPSIFHLSNLAWHTASAMLFYWFIVRMTGKRIWALTASLVFLLHPVQVESVAWLSQRKNVLSMFFLLLTLLCYDYYRKNRDNRRWIFFSAAMIFTILGLFSKVSVVIIPVVLLLYDFCFTDRENRPSTSQTIIEKIPFAVIAALMAYQSSILQLKELGGGRSGYHGGSLFATMTTMVHVLAEYVRLIFWPSNLSAIYTPEVILTPNVVTIGILVVFIVIALAGVELYRRQKDLFFGFCLFLIGLLPVSQIIPLVTLMHDRYLYVPMLGVAWIAGGTASLVWLRRETMRRYLVAAIATLVVIIGIASFNRAKVWKNSVSLWVDTSEKLPGNWGVWDALAEAYISAGDRKGATLAYEKVFSMKPDFMDEDYKEMKALNNAGALFMERGDLGRSRELLELLTKKYPDYAPGFINLGFNMMLQGNIADAEKAYLEALKLEPENTSVALAMGTIERSRGNLKQARAYYLKSFKNRGDGPELRYAMACLEALSGNNNAAIKHLEMAVLNGFNDLKALQNNKELDPLRDNPRFHVILKAASPENQRPTGIQK